MAISTLVTVGVWSAITWKPIWIAAGPTGDKILTVVPLFVSTAWPVSLIWIWSLSQKPQSQIAERLHRTTPAQIVQTRHERPMPPALALTLDYTIFFLSV